MKDGKISMNVASRKFGVPRKTISDHVRGKRADNKLPGIDRMLSNDEELALVNYTEYMSSKNMPLRKSDIPGVVVSDTWKTI